MIKKPSLFTIHHQTGMLFLTQVLTNTSITFTTTTTTTPSSTMYKNKAYTALIHFSQTSKKSCPCIVVIVIDYSLVQTVEFVTRNIVVKAEEVKIHKKMPQRLLFLLENRMETVLHEIIFSKYQKRLRNSQGGYPHKKDAVQIESRDANS